MKMTLRKATIIASELLRDNSNYTNTMHQALSPQRVDAIKRLLAHALNSTTIGHRIPRGPHGPKP